MSSLRALGDCSNLHDIRHWIERIYSPTIYQRLKECRPIEDNSTGFTTPILHVTSCYRPSRPSIVNATPTSLSSSSLYTLRVGAGMPTHPIDRFVLDFSRAISHRIIYTGAILREEPNLQCRYHHKFDGGMKALRRECRVKDQLPNISILTRHPESIDWNHRIFETSRQNIDIIYPSKEAATHTEQRTFQGHSKSVTFRSIGDRSFEEFLLDYARSPLSTDSVEQFPSSTPLSSSLPSSSFSGLFHPFLHHLSLEAGPSVTRQLYQSPAGTTSRPIVQRILVSIFHSNLSREEEKRVLVPNHEAHSPDAIAPSLDLDYLHHHYQQLSEYQDGEWSFHCFERKESNP